MFPSKKMRFWRSSVNLLAIGIWISDDSFPLPFRYENIELALHYGTMLRECIRHQSVARWITWTYLMRFFFPSFFLQTITCHLNWLVLEDSYIWCKLKYVISFFLLPISKFLTVNEMYCNLMLLLLDLFF